MPIQFVPEEHRRRALQAMDSAASFDDCSSPLLEKPLAAAYRALFNRAPKALSPLTKVACVDAKRRSAGDHD
ncbi:hypothetical protein [Pandoraea fibrosis]|uniref:Uncharacterized protein n=1 Tax=Pandoraea fibrosis TaxID=1891094 RepID=A0A5E4SW85_9BURK|nr:hypothetical protein [Pandoraea fibrosis]VVD78069.1 hypothetical protein PFI31113_00962 [Pandoraea fibrosis]